MDGMSGAVKVPDDICHVSNSACTVRPSRQAVGPSTRTVAGPTVKFGPLLFSSHTLVVPVFQLNEW